MLVGEKEHRLETALKDRFSEYPKIILNPCKFISRNFDFLTDQHRDLDTLAGLIIRHCLETIEYIKRIRETSAPTCHTDHEVLPS